MLSKSFFLRGVGAAVMMACFSSFCAPRIINRTVSFDKLASCIHLQCDGPCENLLLDTTSLTLFVSSMSGHLFSFNGARREDLAKNQLDLGKIAKGYCSGIARDVRGNVYVGVTNSCCIVTKSWIVKFDLPARKRDTLTTLKNPFTMINGISYDGVSGLYFCCEPYLWAGGVYRLKLVAPYQVDTVVRRTWLANGISASNTDSLVYFTKTTRGLFCFGRANPGAIVKPRRLLKGSLCNSFDDFCIDKSGRFWIADPERSRIRVADVHNGTIIHIKFRNFGYPTSCRTRIEDGREYLYVTGAKKSNGFGVVSASTDEILNAVKE
jgi:hypothetical protein